MPVTLSDTSARIAAIVLEQYLDDRQRELQHFTRVSALLGTEEPHPMAEQTRSAIELVLGELRTGATERVATDMRQIAELLRELRTPRTLEEVWARQMTDTPLEQVARWLLELEELGHVRQLRDGRGPITWEITEAGENTL